MVTTARSNGTASAVLRPEQVNIEDLAGEDIYTTAKGFKLKVVLVSPDLVLNARRRVPAPTPPQIPVEGQPGKFDEVYTHPKYIKEMDEYNNVISELTFNIIAAYGVQAYGIPAGSLGPEDDWTTALSDEEVYTVGDKTYTPEFPGLDRPRARFAAWLKNYVMAEADASVMQDVFLRGAGSVLEKDVDDAVLSFPGNDGRPADSRVAPAKS